MKTNFNTHFRQLSICLLSIALTACSSLQAEELVPLKKIVSGDNYGKFNDQGQERTYYAYMPKSAGSDRKMPVVLAFHGYGGSGHSMAEVSHFNELAEKQKFIAVYPDGIDHDWFLKGNSKNNLDDVLFTQALLNRLQQTAKIDTQRIYATGFSKGAILTQVLACRLPHKIAAFASVAGSIPTRLQSSCQPQNPVSILAINGTNDQSVHYQGDEPSQYRGLISIPAMVNLWQSYDHCPTAVQDAANANGIPVKTIHYSGCNAGAEVEHLAVVNGGHFWPGGVSKDPDLNKFNAKINLDASKEIWNFFQHHTLSSAS